jgi:hypothetical protein
MKSVEEQIYNRVKVCYSYDAHKTVYDKLSYAVWAHVRSNIVVPITHEHIIGLRNILIENIKI